MRCRYADSTAALCLLVCLAALCGIDSAAAAAESAVPGFASRLEASEGSPVVVCFGDSVTGVYYHTGGRRAYTDMVAIALERECPGVTVSAINAGISGHTTVDALARIGKDVLAHKPDLVTIMFGLNDMTRVPIKVYQKNLATIIRKCRGVGAEVLLCTPNSVCHTSARPIPKLEEYVAVVREVANTEQVPLVDCYRAYEAVRERGEISWAFLMSDEIHPNMDGHKLIAEKIVEAILGSPTSLAEEGPIPSAIPHTLGLLNPGKPVRVLAMPPYDTLVSSSMGALWPDAEIEVTTWPVAGQSLAEIEAYSKGVRAAKPDLVVVAVPADATAGSTQVFIRSYSWVLNNSIGFGEWEWDCIAASPSVAEPKLAGDELEHDRRARRLIRAQDLGMIDRGEGNTERVDALFMKWLENQRLVYGREK